jgi:hypothetical protein
MFVNAFKKAFGKTLGVIAAILVTTLIIFAVAFIVCWILFGLDGIKNAFAAAGTLGSLWFAAKVRQLTKQASD